MPFKPQAPQLADLFDSFLNIVLGKGTLSSRRQLTDTDSRPGFAHRKQRNIARITSEVACRIGDSRLNGLQLQGKWGHNRTLRRYFRV